jgi:NAD(P)-dependent dehydrogenase (short-subunit alcohol dehydrogenase family)
METIFSASLKNKRVIILGGSSGIGLATAQAASGAGAEVVIASSNAERISQALKTLPDGCSGEAVHLGDEMAIQHFFSRAGLLTTSFIQQGRT